MNDKSINSLISAYHDGELTAAERAEVEQLLASSPEAKAELEAYRRMSNLLRDGRPALQSDLTPLVMQTIEQQMLLPKTSTRSRGQSQWTKWVAMAVVAAGLIIAVRLGWQAPPQAPGVANLSNQNKLPPNDDANRVVPKPQDDNQNDDLIAKNQTDPITPEVKPTEIQLAPSDLPLEVIENLKRAAPGKIVRFLTNSGKDVAVFHLMVLDTKPGLDSLQMILSAQQISGPKGQVGQAGVMAVYVEANQDQLDKVIAELQSKDQEQFIALAVQPPMKAEAVQKVVKNQPTDVASQQVPVKQDQLKTLGVNPVQSEQIVASRSNRSSRAPAVPKALGGDDSPMRKVLIVLEKVPESLLPKSAGPQN